MGLEKYEIDLLARELDQALIYAGQGADEPPPEASRAPRYVMPLRAFATSVVTALGREELTGLRVEFMRQDSERTYRVVATTPIALVEGQTTIGDSAEASHDISQWVNRCRLSDVRRVSIAHGALCIRERGGALVPRESSLTLELPGRPEVLLEDHSVWPRVPLSISSVDLLTVRSLVASVVRAQQAGLSQEPPRP